MKPPKLDARDYEALRESLVRRIPVHAPEWTDHNPADPGIAILELFAHLGAQLVDRVNRVPSAAQLEFIKMLGIARRPASPATGLVQLTLQRGTAEAATVDFGPALTPSTVAAGDIVFELQHGLDVVPLEARAFVKSRVDNTLDDIDGVEHMSQALEAELDDYHGDLSELLTYETAPLKPVENGRQPDPVSLYQTTDQLLWIALLAPEDLADQVDTLRDKVGGKSISLGIGIDADSSEAPKPALCGDQSRAEPVRWQVSTGWFRDPADPHPAELRWAPMRPEEDETRGLRYSGRVQLRLPDEIGRWHFDDEDALPAEVVSLPASLRGVGDLPPVLDDDTLEARVVAWVRCFRTASAQPLVRWVALNTARVRQSVTGRRKVLGLGDGRPYQRFRLPDAPVLRDSVELQIKRHGRTWTPCKRVDELIASSADDLHYTLDAVAGMLRFGDGVHGHLPQPGESVRVVSYQRCDGEAGNVGAGEVSTVEHLEGLGVEAVQVSNPLAMAHGRDPETINEARGRIPQQLRHRERAVAAADFGDLAMETPGLQVARAEVLARFKPFETGFEVPGVVTVLVLPAYDPEHPDEPRPNQSFLREVCAWLDPRRLVTTEVYVIGPEYVRIGASVAIEVEAGYGRSTVERWVELTVRQFLAPLPPYGPAGAGWPLGRKVSAADIHAAAVKVEGVRLVHDVRLQNADGARVQQVELSRWQLPSLVAFNVIEGEIAPKVDPLGDATPAQKPTVSVPVIREEC